MPHGTLSARSSAVALSTSQKARPEAQKEPSTKCPDCRSAINSSSSPPIQLPFWSMAKRPLQFATSNAPMAHDEFMTNVAQFDLTAYKEIASGNIQADNSPLIVGRLT